MLVRVWRTHIDDARALEYEAFTRERSLPMFRQQQGFLGVLFARDGASCAVISLWTDAAAVEALSRSVSYGGTVIALSATGLLVGEPSVEVFGLHCGELRSS